MTPDLRFVKIFFSFSCKQKYPYNTSGLEHYKQKSKKKKQPNNSEAGVHTKEKGRSDTRGGKSVENKQEVKTKLIGGSLTHDSAA